MLGQSPRADNANLTAIADPNPPLRRARASRSCGEPQHSSPGLLPRHSSTVTFNSSELPTSSGAYMPLTLAGSALNLLRWTSPRTIKETFSPPKDWRYPFLG